MKNIMKLAVIGALAAMVVQHAHAQSNTVQTLSVALTGWAGTGGTSNSTTAAAVRIANKDVRTALAGATGVNFSSRASLLMLVPVGGGTPVFVIRDKVGRTNVDTDVSGFITTATTLAVDKSTVNARGQTIGSEYRIDTFGFGGAGSNATTTASFTVQGFTTASLSNGSSSSSVNGTGSVSGNDAVLKGTISSSARKLDK